MKANKKSTEKKASTKKAANQKSAKSAERKPTQRERLLEFQRKMGAKPVLKQDVIDWMVSNKYANDGTAREAIGYFTVNSGVVRFKYGKNRAPRKYDPSIDLFIQERGEDGMELRKYDPAKHGNFPCNPSSVPAKKAAKKTAKKVLKKEPAKKQPAKKQPAKPAKSKAETQAAKDAGGDPIEDIFSE